MWRDRIKMMARIGPWVHADIPQYFLPDLPHRMASGAENFAQVLVSYEISNPHTPLPFILDAGRWEWITPPQRSFLVPFFFLEREGDFERATTTMDVKQMKWADPQPSKRLSIGFHARGLRANPWQDNFPITMPQPVRWWRLSVPMDPSSERKNEKNTRLSRLIPGVGNPSKEALEGLG